MSTQNRMARFDRMAVIESQIQHRAELRKRASNLLDLDPSGSGNVLPAIRELIDVVDWRLIGKKIRSVVKGSQTWEGKDRHGRSQIKVISDTRNFFRKGPGRKGFAQSWFPIAAVPMRKPHLYELLMDTGSVTIKKDDDGNPVSAPVFGFAYIVYRDENFFVSPSNKKLDAEEAHKRVVEDGVSHYRSRDPNRGPLMWGRTASRTETENIYLTHKNHTPKRRLPMRRSAGEIIRNLEMRIARLERQAGPRERIIERAKENKARANRASTLYEDMVDFCKVKMAGMPKEECVRAFVARFKDSDPRLLKTIAFTFFSSKFPLHQEVQKTNGSLTAIAKAICDDPEWAKRRQRKASDIAATIIQQLGGGRKLQMMIGLKQLVNEPLGVTLVFPLPKHKGAVNRVRITLNGKDLYDMEFIRYRAGKVKVVSTFNDVYAEDIKDRFEEGTGLYIRF